MRTNIRIPISPERDGAWKRRENVLSYYSIPESGLQEFQKGKNKRKKRGEDAGISGILRGGALRPGRAYDTIPAERRTGGETQRRTRPAAMRGLKKEERK